MTNQKTIDQYKKAIEAIRTVLVFNRSRLIVIRSKVKTKKLYQLVEASIIDLGNTIAMIDGEIEVDDMLRK